MNIAVQRNASRLFDGFGNVWAGGTPSTDERFESNLTAVDPLSQEIRKNAIASGPSVLAKGKVRNTPELKDQRNATVLYVFGL